MIGAGPDDGTSKVPHINLASEASESLATAADPGDCAQDQAAWSPLLSDPPQPLPGWKRSLDVLGALALLVALSPVLGACILFIQLRDPGPILFRQTRIGYRATPFQMLKLRTMRVRADEDHHRSHLRALIASNARLTKLDSVGDRRIVPGATAIRAFGIDEVPQLVNVLRGDMSLVGPRPCMPYELDCFEERHFQRFRVRPGLTGLWQVSGKNRTTFQQMLELDLRYAQRVRLIRDLGILLRTPAAVIESAREARAHQSAAACNTPDTRAETCCESGQPTATEHRFEADASTLARHH